MSAALAQLVINIADLILILDNVCHLTPTQTTTLVEDGYYTGRSIVHWDFKSINNWCYAKSKIPVNCGGCIYGDLKIKCIQALSYWCTNTHLQGNPLDIINKFDDDALDGVIIESELDYNDSNKDTVLDKPNNFSHEKWQEWEESVYNYFASFRNARSIPYAYIIRKMPNSANPANMERDDFIIYNAELTDTMFKCDSKHVHYLLKELTNGTQAEDWIKGKSCGRTEMIALQNHYNGKAESERRMSISKADLTKLFYRNESTFSFEKYVTKHLAIFSILDKSKLPIYEKEKVDHLLNNIQCPDKDFHMTVNICRSSHSNDFIQASTYLQTEVVRIFPDSRTFSGRYGNRRYIQAFDRGRGRCGDGKGRGRFGVRGGRGGYNKNDSGRRKGNTKPNKENGVDISNPTCWYEHNELSVLSSTTRNYILQHPDRIRRRNEKCGTSAVESSQRSKDNQVKLITAVINTQRNAGAVSSVVFPKNGSNRNRNTPSILRTTPPSQVSIAGSSEAIVLTFNHFGSIIEWSANVNQRNSKMNDEWDYYKSIPSEISRIKTGLCRNIGKI